MFSPQNVNLTRTLEEIKTLSTLGGQPSGGMTRLTYSDEHLQATHTVAGWMKDAGLEVYFDRWGNLFGRTPGFDDREKVVLTGSHLDSVPNGGNYDGPLGVLSSLEAVRAILESGLELKRPIEVVSFIEEEGASFAGLLGSRLAINEFTNPETLGSNRGAHFLEILDSVKFGYPVKPDVDLRQRVESYLELHIEQGRRLENAGIPIGAVTAIASPNFLEATLTGRSDHAGATEYADRHDALLAAAEVIVAIRQVGTTRFKNQGHMTVGHIQAFPNVANVVAGKVILKIDFRSADDSIAEAMTAAVDAILAEKCESQGVSYDLKVNQHVPAAITPARIYEAVTEGAKTANVACQDIVSWAAHDAMVMARVCDSGMIFVPCRNGRSHTPEEYTGPEDIAAGIATLANALYTLAN